MPCVLAVTRAFQNTAFTQEQDIRLIFPTPNLSWKQLPRSADKRFGERACLYGTWQCGAAETPPHLNSFQG